MIRNLEIKNSLNCGTVIAGCYEDRVEQMNLLCYYGIRMDSMVMPEEDFVVKQFYGTLDQIHDLMKGIDKDTLWRGYYASSLDALERYQSGDEHALHYVGGEVERFLKPVVEVCRSAFLLDNPKWVYQDRWGCFLRARADVVCVHQVLLWDGNKFTRCARYGFEGLKYVRPDKGWITYDGKSCGVPHMIDSHATGDAYSRLFVVEEEYDNLDAAKWDMQREDVFNYEQISRELFSGC